MKKTNLVYISPDFPDNFHTFIQRANETEINVLAITECDYHSLPDILKRNITGHYKVNSYHNKDEMVKACIFFQNKFGKIDFIESNIESWLYIESYLRTQFDIKGIKEDNINRFIKKSEMKRIFEKANIKTAKGFLVYNKDQYQDLLNFIKEIKYPVIAKPDHGVGANETYKITSDIELDNFWDNWNPYIPYFIEEFIEGRIETFDGLTDNDGNIVFSSSLVYSGTLEMLYNKKFYYLEKNVCDDIKQNGSRAIKEFNIKNKFFHLEFFRTSKDELYGLELNMRPPGGFTIDMMNFSCDIDLYKEWANILNNNRFYSNINRKYYVGFASREDWITYSKPHHEVMEQYKNNIMMHRRMPEIFAKLMGNDAYIIRTRKLSELHDIFEDIMRSI